VVVAVTVDRLNPDRTAVGRIAIIAADPDPASADPFIVTGDPDCAGIRAAPGMVNVRRRRGRRSADLDADADLRRGVAGGNCQEGERRATKSGSTKRSYIHVGLDGG
jgi:hypothetical protein